MSNRRILEDAFRAQLQLPAEASVEELVYNESKGWDSLTHLNIVAAIEESFDIMLETDDVLDMSSYSKATEILAKYVTLD